MDKTTTLLLGAGAILAFSALNKTSAAKSLNFYPDSTGMDAFLDGVTPIVRFRMAVQNPSNQTYTIRSLVGNVYANTYLIGNVSSFVQSVIQPLATSYIQVVTRFSLLGIATDIFNAIISGQPFSEKVSLKANANVDGFLVPINIDYKIG